MNLNIIGMCNTQSKEKKKEIKYKTVNTEHLLLYIQK